MPIARAGVSAPALLGIRKEKTKKCNFFEKLFGNSIFVCIFATENKQTTL